MRFRRYDIDLPKDLDERLKKALEAVKKRGLLPEHTTERDFLVATVFTNGLAMVEADLTKRDRAERSVLLPQEIEWPKNSSPSGLPGSGLIARK
jgi:hypothetical protein